MDEWTRDLLTAVREGRVDPDEALEQLQTRPGAAPDPVRLELPVSRVALRVGSRHVRVVGDPSVTTVSVEGPHEITQEGDQLVITGSWDHMRGSGDGDGFVLTPFRRFMKVAGKHLVVRVNPALAVEADVAAGSVTVEGVPHVALLRVVAGSARATGLTEPFEVAVQAGSATIEACPRHGTSQVRCETGSVSLRLLPGSDVRVQAHAELGKVTLPKGTAGDKRPRASGAAVHQTSVIGAGTATLDIDVTLGGVDVRSDA